MLEDIAILTGGQPVMEETGIKLEGVQLEDWAGAKRVTVDKDVDNDRGRQGLREVHRGADQAAPRADRGDHLRLRPREAAGAAGEAGRRVAIIKVGAATETEMKEKKARVEDALHATRAAVEEASFRASAWLCCARSHALKSLKLEGDEQIGVAIVKRACEEPLRQIVVRIPAPRGPLWSTRSAT